jgi:hypothetical protein
MQVLDDFLRRRAAGEPVSEAALLTAHPELVDELREHLEIVMHLQPADQHIGDLIAKGILQYSTDARFAAALGPYQIMDLIGRGGMGLSCGSTSRDSSDGGTEDSPPTCRMMEPPYAFSARGPGCGRVAQPAHRDDPRHWQERGVHTLPGVRDGPSSRPESPARRLRRTLGIVSRRAGGGGADTRRGDPS